MTAPGIVVEGVGKRYRQYHDESSLVARLLAPHRARHKTDLWALRDLDFTVQRGGTVGVIGRNGSGKTTLLRLLSGVSAPTVGRVAIWGRVAPLIGVGVGFNQELTGRENVHVNGRLLGMTADEVDRKYDQIVAFSEVEEFVDVPVKFYSSGMFLRLAFSVAIHTDPQVMVVDEILAVGDVGFQAKCFDRLREIQHAGATIVVVTHNLQVLQRLTERTIVLDHGRMLHDGDTEAAIEVFHEVMESDRAERAGAGAPGLATARATVLDDTDATTLQVPSGQPMRFRIDVQFTEQVEDPVVGFAIERVGLGILYATGSERGAYRGTHGPDRPLHSEITLQEVPLLAGTYLLRGVVYVGGMLDPVASSEPVLFHVSSMTPGGGSVAMDARITIEGQPVPLTAPTLSSIDQAR